MKIGFFWKNTSGGFFDGKSFRRHASPYAIRGTSDILGILNGGRFVALEVKDKSGITEEQAVFIRKVVELGGVGACVRSLDDVRKALTKSGVVFLE